MGTKVILVLIVTKVLEISRLLLAIIIKHFDKS